jgi:hypothetical protein
MDRTETSEHPMESTMPDFSLIRLGYHNLSEDALLKRNDTEAMFILEFRRSSYTHPFESARLGHPVALAMWQIKRYEWRDADCLIQGFALLEECVRRGHAIGTFFVSATILTCTSTVHTRRFV